METTVRHEPEKSRFIVDLPGGEAVVEYARPDPQTMDIQHTFVPEAGRGMGLAGKLVTAACEHARAESLRIIPTCPYVPRFLEKNPVYADLVKGA